MYPLFFLPLFMSSIQGLFIWTPFDYFRDSTQRRVIPVLDPHNICRISLHVGQNCKSGWKRKRWVGLSNTFPNKPSFQWRTVGRELDGKELTWHLRLLNIPLHKMWTLNESILSQFGTSCKNKAMGRLCEQLISTHSYVLLLGDL